jgi:hypothetical protein
MNADSFADALAELVEQAGLAHTRFGHNVDHVQLPARLSQAALENV